MGLCVDEGVAVIVGGSHVQEEGGEFAERTFEISEVVDEVIGGLGRVEGIAGC